MFCNISAFRHLYCSKKRQYSDITEYCKKKKTILVTRKDIKVIMLAVLNNYRTDPTLFPKILTLI